MEIPAMKAVSSFGEVTLTPRAVKDYVHHVMRSAYEDHGARRLYSVEGNGANGAATFHFIPVKKVRRGSIFPSYPQSREDLADMSMRVRLVNDHIVGFTDYSSYSAPLDMGVGIVDFERSLPKPTEGFRLGRLKHWRAEHDPTVKWLDSLIEGYPETMNTLSGR